MHVYKPMFLKGPILQTFFLVFGCLYTRAFTPRVFDPVAKKHCISSELQPEAVTPQSSENGLKLHQARLHTWSMRPSRVYTCMQRCSSTDAQRINVSVVMQVTVILEHMFHPSEMEEEATLREDLEDDIKTECTKMGPVEKVRYSPAA